MKLKSIAIPLSAIEEFCRRRGIRRLSVFGSALREDFRAESDIDLLVEFDPETRHDLWDHFFMREELQNIFGRSIDLINRESLEHSANSIRRREILDNAETIYVAR